MCRVSMVACADGLATGASYEARLLASETILGVGELGLSVLNSIGHVTQVCRYRCDDPSKSELRPILLASSL